jgi:hypothetical protein
MKKLVLAAIMALMVCVTAYSAVAVEITGKVVSNVGFDWKHYAEPKCRVKNFCVTNTQVDRATYTGYLYGSGREGTPWVGTSQSIDAQCFARGYRK